MASYLRPRRGLKATAESQNIVLKRGEVFFETNESGVGKGSGRIFMGDGSTAYTSLPCMITDINNTNAMLAFTDSSAADSTSAATLLGKITPSNNLKTVFTNLKQLLWNFNSAITSLNNDKVGTETLTTTATTCRGAINELNNNKLSTSAVGTAAAKDYTTSVTSGSTDVITSGGVYSALGTQCSYSLSGTTLTITSK